MRIHHLNCGSSEPLGGRLMGGEGHPLRKARGVCHCLLLETDRALVLVDSGLGMGDIERPVERLGKPFVRLARPVLDPDQTALRQIRSLGYDPADLTHIVLTHLDPDHAGGLSDFPHARVHLLEDEHRAATAPSGGGKVNPTRVNQKQWAHGPRWQTYRLGVGERWFGFEAVRELRGLAPEILLVPLPGHTLGHTGVAVRLDSTAGSQDRWLLHAGDAYFARTELDRDNPRAPAGVALFEKRQQVDAAARMTNQARLRALVNAHPDQVEVISSHDPAELDHYQLKAAAAR
ncbi:MBL fold metallo-hydrolase [Mycobacterium sp. 1081908.1]|uniref:MBL fold metallo-hydrolase n=1 Tax=Mycobacterium sp. 1081908.1 TaxID=1834066 RepID=UPI0008006EA4|nr:MBL fold metallo-hydrolase [Mycobacterium sp. 1081908.1]OBK43147.1 MBL fold metallo-hydrolase [Mycobacterium sp. 1081908.1]